MLVTLCAAAAGSSDGEGSIQYQVGTTRYLVILCI
jgi:hypothetical protein